jgi:predicted chitinase
MSFFDTQSLTAKNNALILLQRLKNRGITNIYSQTGIFCVVSKECGFVPKNELSYSNTSNARLKKVFGSRLSELTDEKLNELKKNDIDFFETIYGIQHKWLGLGNTNYGDAHAYKGRGFNQITGKALYQAYSSKLGIDLVKTPELLNDVGIAADCLIEYFKDKFNYKGAKLKEYNTTGINDFKNYIDSIGAFYHANSGWGFSMQSILADVTGGRKKSMERGAEFYEFIKKNENEKSM